MTKQSPMPGPRPREGRPGVETVGGDIRTDKYHQVLE